MRSFTLVELIVSLAVLIILSSILLVSPSRGPESYRFTATVQKLVADIERAKSFSLGARVFKASVPSGGWGVHFVKGESCYILFGDENANGLYDGAGETLCDANAASPASERFERVFLSEGVEISLLTPTDSVDIIYLPPLPRIFVNGSETTNVQITLRSKALNVTKTIIANIVGNVSVQ
ncbi:MAG: hypothetical protein HY001_02700 [Candidatus Portnoybacteria bacterium]|nr:hypothetical protein [Candidatus Portnoybacteria bacterium]